MRTKILTLLIVALLFTGGAFAQSQPEQIPLDSLKLSEKLKVYIRKVEQETSRRVIVEPRNQLAVPGLLAAFTRSPTDLLVLLHSSVKPDDPNMEFLLAHEVTHGCLAYASGYAHIRVWSSASAEEKRLVSLAATMLEDAVVHSLVQKEGLAFHPLNYLAQLKGEIADLARPVPFAAYAGEPVYRSRLAALLYVQNYCLLRYCKLDKALAHEVRLFLTTFEKACPQEYKDASRIKAVIDAEGDNIFKADGHRRILAQVLKLWGLEGAAVLD